MNHLANKKTSRSMHTENAKKASTKKKKEKKREKTVEAMRI